jgi:Xaa-Pro aminopeptidase
MEYEIEAEFIHEFLVIVPRVLLTPIMVLEIMLTFCIIENNQQCKDGDLILMLVQSMPIIRDMTRTIPVSGKFSDRQKAVYNAVLNVKKKLQKCLSQTLWKQYHIEVGKLMTSELLGLGLIDKADVQNENPDWPAYKNISCTVPHTIWD